MFRTKVILGNYLLIILCVFCYLSLSVAPLIGAPLGTTAYMPQQEIYTGPLVNTETDNGSLVSEPPVVLPDYNATNLMNLSTIRLPVKEAINHINFPYSIKGASLSDCGYPNSNYLFLAPAMSGDDVPILSGILVKFDLGPILLDEVVSARLRLVLANPASIPGDALDIRAYETSNQWDSTSFSVLCKDEHCYMGIEDLLALGTNEIITTGTLESSSELKGRQVLLVDITDMVNKWLSGGEHEGSIFFSLWEDEADDGPFDSYTFYGNTTKYVALRPKLEVMVYGTGGVNATGCGDGVCTANETCQEDCDVPVATEPPDVALTTSEDQYVMTPQGPAAMVDQGVIQLFNKGTPLTLTARMYTCEDGASGNETASMVSNGVPDSMVQSAIPGIGLNITEVMAVDLATYLEQPTPKRVMIWEAGRQGVPKNVQLCSSDSCNCSITVYPEIGPHLYCARAIDEYGNMSSVRCRSVYVGSGVRPIINYQIVPKYVTLPWGIYPNTEMFLKVKVSQPMGGVTYGINKVKVEITSYEENDHDVLNWEYTLSSPSDNWETYLPFTVPKDLQPRPNVPKKLYISVKAWNVEGLSTQTTGTIEITRPIQMEYGLPFKNSGNDAMCWDEYHMTFGDEIYGSISFCGFFPFIFPGVCWDNVVCTCTKGTPGSGLQKAVNILGGWIVDTILEVLGLDSGLESFFCVDDLDDIGIPSLKALFYYPFYRYVAAMEGRCTGFSTATASMYAAQSYNPVYPGTTKDISEWTEDVDTPVRKYLDSRQGAVMSNEFIKRLFQNFSLTTTEVLSQVEEELRDGKHGGISILGWPIKDDFSCQPEGHTMFVDHLEYMGNNIVRLYVYDSNRPYGDYSRSYDLSTKRYNPYIQFMNDEDDFEFLHGLDEDGNNITWTRGNRNGTCSVDFDIGDFITGGQLPDEMVLSIPIFREHMGAVPLYLPTSLLLKDDFTLPKVGELLAEGGLNFLLLFIGNSDVEISDGEGHALTTGDQQGQATIPNSFMMALPGTEGGSFHVALLPPGGEYTVNFKAKDNGKGQLLALFGPVAGKAVNLFMTSESEGSLGLSLTQDKVINIALVQGNIVGSINFLSSEIETVGEVTARYIEEEATDEEAPENLKETPLDYYTLFSVKGAFMASGTAFSFSPSGTIELSTPTKTPVSVHLLTNKILSRTKLDEQDVADAMVGATSKNIILEQGTHTVYFEPQVGTVEPDLRLSGPYSFNGAPGVLRGACTLEQACGSQATTLRLTEDAKKEIAIVPRLEVPKDMVGKAGKAYCLMYWREKATFFMVTETGIEPFNGVLKPYASVSQFSPIMSFPILQDAMDLSGFKGTLDIFMAVTTREDLGDMTYNWYEVVF